MASCKTADGEETYLTTRINQNKPGISTWPTQTSIRKAQRSKPLAMGTCQPVLNSIFRNVHLPPIPEKARWASTATLLLPINQANNCNRFSMLVPAKKAAKRRSHEKRKFIIILSRFNRRPPCSLGRWRSYHKT